MLFGSRNWFKFALLIFNSANYIFKKCFNFYEKYLGVSWVADYKSKVRSLEKNGWLNTKLKKLFHF